MLFGSLACGGEVCSRLPELLTRFAQLNKIVHSFFHILKLLHLSEVLGAIVGNKVCSCKCMSMRTCLYTQVFPVLPIIAQVVLLCLFYILCFMTRLIVLYLIVLVEVLSFDFCCFCGFVSNLCSFVKLK